MKTFLLLFISVILTLNFSKAQTDTTKFTKSQQKDSAMYNIGWNNKGVIGIRLSQVALTNWVKGGENSIHISGFSDFSANHYSHPWLWKNRLKVDLGSSKTGTSSFRTNENEASLENILIYKAKWILYPYVSNEVRTGILNAYDYKKEKPEQTSAFFDPGYITQSIGLIYDRKHFSSRLGLAFQETFTNKFRNYTDDLKTDKKEAFKFETGVESVTDAYTSIAENLYFSTRLRLFSAFKTIDVWDVTWDNTITAKVNSFIAVNLNVLVVYEKAQSPKTQMKEGLDVGIAYTLFK